MARAARRHTFVSFSRREAASLAGVRLSVVDKAIEQRVLAARSARQRSPIALTGDDIIVLAIIGRSPMPLPVRDKRRIREWVRKLPPEERAGAELALSPVVVVRCDEEAAERGDAAERYGRLRDEYIEIDPKVQGGEPVIRGTRTTVRSIAARLDAGESIDDLADDYPHIPPEAFETTAIYARTHPRRGRPPRPWREAA